MSFLLTSLWMSLLYIFFSRISTSVILYIGETEANTSTGTYDSPFATFSDALQNADPQNSSFIFLPNADCYEIIELNIFDPPSFLSLSSYDPNSPSCLQMENTIFDLSNTTAQISFLTIFLNSFYNDYQNLFYVTESNLEISNSEIIINVTINSTLFSYQLISSFDDPSIYSSIISLISTKVVWLGNTIMIYKGSYSIFNITNLTMVLSQNNDYSSLFEIYCCILTILNTNIRDILLYNFIDALGGAINIENSNFVNLTLRNTNYSFVQLIDDGSTNCQGEIQIINTVFSNITLIQSMGQSSYLIYISFSNLQANFSNMTLNSIISNTTMLVIENSQSVFINNNIISENVYFNAIYFQSIENVNILNTSCLFNNLQNNIFNSDLGSCFFLLDVQNLVMVSNSIKNCYSNYTTTGIRITYTDSYTLVDDNNNVSITNSIFDSNFANLSKVYEGGCVLYISSSENMDVYFTNCTFNNNSLNLLDIQTLFGSPAIRSVGLGENIIISNSSFTSQTASHLSSAISVVGQGLTLMNVMFKYNNLNIEYALEDNGYGTVSFFGISLLVNGCIFQYNQNVQGAGIYIDGTSNMHATMVEITNTCFYSNVAITGAGISMGYSILEIAATLNNVTCFNNSVSEIGGSIFIYFKNKNSQFNITNSLFYKNNGIYGGAIHMTHESGNVTVINSKFLENLTPIDKSSVGGVFSVTGFISTYLVSYNNFYYMNSAYRAGVIGATYVQLFDFGSNYISNHAILCSSIYLETLGSLVLINSTFINESSTISAIFTFAVVCMIDIQNVYIENFSSYYDAIVLNTDILGQIRNLTFKNHSTTLGPTLTFINLPDYVLCTDITLVSSNFTNVYPSKIGVMWNSLVNFSNFSITNFQGRGFFEVQYYSELNLENISVTNFIFWNQGKGCFLFIGSQSVVSATGLKFENIVTNNSLIYVDNSNMTLEEISLNQIQLTNDTKDGCYLYLDSSSIVNINNMQVNSFINQLIFQQTAYLTINNSTIDNDCDNSPYLSMLYAYNLAQIIINNSVISNQIYKSGALLLQGPSINQLIILQSSFLNNSSPTGGAFYLQNPGNIIINSCSFFQNQGISGGAIYYSEDGSAVQLVVSNSTFINNNASMGGVIYSDTNMPFFTNDNYFQNNTASYGAIFASYAIRLALKVIQFTAKGNKTIYNSLLQNQTFFTLQHEYPGMNLQKLLYFEALDHYNQTVNTMNGSLFLVGVQNYDINTLTRKKMFTPQIAGQITASIVNGNFVLQNFSISGLPSNVYYYYIQSNSINFPPNMQLLPNERISSSTYYYFLPVKLDKCPAGGILVYNDQGYFCDMCDSNKYSLSMYGKCEECPEGGTCVGGIIMPMPGYWRPQVNSSDLIACNPYPEACLGGSLSTCAIGYEGVLCQSCGTVNGTTYSKQRNTVCEKCYGETALIIFTIFIIACFILFFYFFLKSNLESLGKMNFSNIGKDDSQVTQFLSSAYLKIFLNYLQLISLIGYLELNWTKSLNQIFNSSQILTGSFFQMISLDCLFKDHMPTQLVYFVPLLSGILPWFILFLIIFLMVFFALIMKQKLVPIFEKFAAIMIITIFSMQPSIIIYLLTIISCEKIDGNNYYITSYKNERCFTERHYNWIYKLFVPGFVFYGCLLPAAAFSYMKANEKHLHEQNYVRKIGFLSSGYKRKKFYWEFLFFYRKVLIIFFTQFFQWKIEIKTLTILVILFISLWQQAKDNPYVTDDLNSLDFKATLFTFGTIFTGLFSFECQSTVIETIVLIFVFFINIYFIYLWIKKMIILKLPLFRKYQEKSKWMNCCFKILDKLEPDFEILKQDAYRSLVVYRKTLRESVCKSPHKKASLFASFKSRFSKLTFTGINLKPIEKISLKLENPTPELEKNEGFESKPKSNMKFLLQSQPSKKKLNNASFELTSSHFKYQSNTPKLFKGLASPHDNSSNDESSWIEKSSRIEQNDAKGDIRDEINYMSFKDSGREGNESSNMSQRNIRNSFDDLHEENHILKRMLKVKQNAIENLFEKIKNLEKETENLKNQNEALKKTHGSIETHQIKEIRQMEFKHNETYFKEKELDGQFTQDNSSLVVSYDSKEFSKNILTEKEIKENFHQNKATILCYEQNKFSFFFHKNKGSYGMITSMDFQILSLGQFRSCEILVNAPNCTFFNIYFIENFGNLDIFADKRKFYWDYSKDNFNKTFSIFLEKILRKNVYSKQILTLEFILASDPKNESFEINIPLPECLFFKIEETENNKKNVDLLYEKYKILYHLEMLPVWKGKFEDFGTNFPCLNYIFDENTNSRSFYGRFRLNLEGKKLKFLLIIEAGLSNDIKCLIKGKANKMKLVLDERNFIVEFIKLHFLEHYLLDPCILNSSPIKE